MNTPLPFRDDCLLLSGGSGGIGRATIIEFVRRGARVLFGDVDEWGAKNLIESLGADAERVRFVPSDYAQENAWPNMLAALPPGWNPTILISNVGVGSKLPIGKLPLGDYERIMNINLRSAFIGVQAVLPWFEKAGRGVALFVGSVMSEAISPCSTVYTTSKGGMTGLMRSLSIELAPKNIRVNVIQPGMTRVEPPSLYRKHVPRDLWAEFSEHFDREISSRFESMQPLPRCIRSDDIARAAAFLCSEEARCITGVELPVDGGIILRSGIDETSARTVEKWIPEMEQWLNERKKGK